MQEVLQQWTAGKVARIFALLLIAGLAEIGGGWLVWQAVREGRPSWWAIVGVFLLAAYGYIPCAQPLDDFGRLYAVYGGVFIAMSFCWGWLFDGMRLDRGDMIGSVIAAIGVCVVLFWPRGEQDHEHYDHEEAMQA